MAVYDSQTQSKSTRNSRAFRDIDLDFTRNAVTNDVNVVEDVIAVKRSVRNLSTLLCVWSNSSSKIRNWLGSTIEFILYPQLSVLLYRHSHLAERGPFVPRLSMRLGTPLSV